MEKEPNKRLGFIGGVNDLKRHNWLHSIDWKSLYNFNLKTDFIPYGENNYESRFVSKKSKWGEDTEQRYESIIKSSDYKSAFNDYTYFNRYDINNQGLKMVFFNIHEKIYKQRNLQRNNSGDKLKKNKVENNSGINIGTVASQIRSISPYGERPSKAFNEANKFINRRKNMKIKYF